MLIKVMLLGWITVQSIKKLIGVRLVIESSSMTNLTKFTLVNLKYSVTCHKKQNSFWVSRTMN